MPTGPNYSTATVRASRIYALSSTGRDYQHVLQRGSAVATRLLRSVFDRASAVESYPRKIVLQRKYTRRLVFDNETKQALKNSGFQMVCTDDMELQQQIDLYSRAELIIAAHGAGLSNLVFCRPGVRVLEIFPQGYSTRTFCLLALTVGAIYSCAVVPIYPLEGAQLVRDNDLAVPFSVVEGWLEFANDGP